MNLSNITGFGFVLIFFILMLVFFVLSRKDGGGTLRDIGAFSRISRAIGMAVEAGKRLHISLGRGSIIGVQAAPALVGLSVLERIARTASMSDRPMISTSGEGTLAILSQGAMKSAYRNLNILSQYDPNYGRLSGLTPFAYACGTIPVIYDEESSLNILLGHFGSEIALIADASERSGGMTLAGSDSLPAQAILYAAAHEPLIGEEVYAASAYVQAGLMHTASLRAQDALRWLFVAVLFLGALLKLAGIV